MAPVGIKYYKCQNQGIGILIYPQLRGSDNPSNDIVWDGRAQSGFHYMIAVGGFAIVNLVAENVSTNAVFYLSENTVFGMDEYETEQSFYVDPNSNLVATGTRWGSVDIGSLSYDGTKPYNLKVEDDHALSLAKLPSELPTAICEVLRHLGRLEGYGASKKKYKGSTLWPNPNVIAVGATLILAFLIHKGYTVTFDISGTSAYFHLSPNQGEYDEYDEIDEKSVPKKVQKDWDDAVVKADKYHVVNKGIVEET